MFFTSEKKKKALVIGISLCIFHSVAYASAPTFRERIAEILGTNPYSIHYKGPKAFNDTSLEVAEPAGDQSVFEEEAKGEAGNFSSLLYESAAYRKQLESLTKKADKKISNPKPVKSLQSGEKPSSKELIEKIDDVLTKEDLLEIKDLLKTALKDKDKELAKTAISSLHKETYRTADKSPLEAKSEPVKRTLNTDKVYDLPVRIEEDESLDYLESNEENSETKLFTYRRGESYEVSSAPGYITDIQLMAGEQLLNITIGDTRSWTIETKAISGQNTWHVYVKPLQVGISTNAIIETDKHTYSLRLVAERDYAPIVSWIYPEEREAVYKPEGVTMEVENVQELNFDYKVSKAKKYPWTPETVFDDGFKTYFVLSDKAAMKYTPAVFQKRASGQLIHLDYRVINNMLVVNKVCEEFFLCTDNNDFVNVKNCSADNIWGR